MTVLLEPWAHKARASESVREDRSLEPLFRVGTAALSVCGGPWRR